MALVGSVALSALGAVSSTSSRDLEPHTVLQVRDHPLYHFTKARALSKSGDYPEAIKTLKMITKSPTPKTEKGRKLRGPSLQPSERVSILLELADALRRNGELVRTAWGSAMLEARGWGCWGPCRCVLADVYSCRPLSLYSRGSISLSCLKVFSDSHCPQNNTQIRVTCPLPTSLPPTPSHPRSSGRWRSQAHQSQLRWIFRLGHARFPGTPVTRALYGLCPLGAAPCSACSAV